MSPSSVTSNSKGKGKQQVIDDDEVDVDSDSASDSDSDSDSESPSDSGAEESEMDDGIGGENNNEEEEVLFSPSRPPIPKLSLALPAPYLTCVKPTQSSNTQKGQASTLASRLISIRDPELEKLEKATASFDGPAPPMPPPELTKSGKPLTKKQKKELKNRTAGPDWFHLPAPSEADLPRMYREVEALRLRNQLDPKRFYKKDEGEGKGIKGLPKYFAIGTVLPTPTPFATPSTDNLVRSKRKKTLVEELMDDAEARHYAKRKFNDLQADRGAKGRNTLRAKQMRRMPKW